MYGISRTALVGGTLVFNTLIAVVLTLIGFGDRAGFWVNFVFSQCIGLGVCLFLMGGARLIWPRRWPPAWGLALLAAVAVPAAWYLGSLAALRITGLPRQALSVPGASFVVTITASALGVAYFWSRERRRRVAQAATEARLKLLQAQIEPHFLFNTLANLDALILTDPPRARKLLGHFNAYLRSTLVATRKDWSTLGDEFELLRGYLEVQAVRMGERLRHRLDLPSAIATATLPPMLLQPLVENAIKHGLEPRVEGGEIAVTASNGGGGIVVAIADTGSGESSAGGNGVGLDNVRERLRAVGGTLDYRRNDSGGVTVTVHIPQ